MKIYIGADHAGFKLKEKLIPFLIDLGYEVVDKGAFSYNEDDDYPDFVEPVAEAISTDTEAKGIVIGGSGEGEAMATDRFPPVRPALLYGCHL